MSAARSVLFVAVAGCWRSQPPESPTIASRADADRAQWSITANGVGPFGKNTEATVPALQALVPTLRVVEHDLGGESGIVYDVFDRDEKLFYIVPDDVTGWNNAQNEPRRYARTMFAIFAVSGRVQAGGRSWRVGQPFREVADLDTCECWGDREVTACFRRGGHIRVIFELPCDAAEVKGPSAMLGKPVARIMWKREVEEPFVDVDEGVP